MNIVIPSNLNDDKTLLLFFKQLYDIIKKQDADIKKLQKEAKDGS